MSPHTLLTATTGCGRNASPCAVPPSAHSAQATTATFGRCSLSRVQHHPGGATPLGIRQSLWLLPGTSPVPVINQGGTEVPWAPAACPVAAAAAAGHACRAFGSSLTGAFSEVSMDTGATGTVVLASVTPVNVTVDLQGITTLKVAAPAGGRPVQRAAVLRRCRYWRAVCLQQTACIAACRVAARILCLVAA